MKRELREILKSIIEYVLKRKGLHYILYILVAFWIREATNLSAGEAISTFLAAVKGEEQFPHWRYLAATIGGILFTEGSYKILGLTSVMILFFGFLKYKEFNKPSGVSPAELIDHIKGIEKNNKFLTSPPPKTTGFVGREQDLQELDARLKAKNQVLLVNGLGGIGKTEVCRSYFWANTNKFGKLGW
ncbi:ATP-binding protein, partial [candidate division KSB1 bacterium]|nr:ATP-binding protein [candidate division KSB1 bacterium]